MRGAGKLAGLIYRRRPHNAKSEKPAIILAIMKSIGPFDPELTNKKETRKRREKKGEKGWFEDNELRGKEDC